MQYSNGSMGTAKHRAAKRGGGKTRCRKGARVAVQYVNAQSRSDAALSSRKRDVFYGSVADLMASISTRAVAV